MTWNLSAYIDDQVRTWMKERGWEVSRTDYDFGSKVYSWRHSAPGGKSLTLRITGQVLDEYPAFAVLYYLDILRVAAAMRRNPRACLVVRQRGSAVVLEEDDQPEE
jgi:hypothetical protein